MPPFAYLVPSTCSINRPHFSNAHVNILDIAFVGRAYFDMPSPATKMLRLWKYNVLIRRLTFIVFAIVAAVLCRYAIPIKMVLCTADLPRAHSALQLASFQTAQSIICSEKDILPKSNAWNLSYHQGGNGPWIPKVDGVINDDLALPAGCVVDQVNMVSSIDTPKGANRCIE
jgi:hypothetical protein